MGYLETHPWITFELDLTRAPTRFWTLLEDACSKCEVISGIPLMPETAEELNRVSLERGARATTAIEGNTLTEEQVALLARGELRLPPSKEYLGMEMKNILRGFNEMLDVEHAPALGAERVKYLNAVVLDGLKLDEGVPAARAAKPGYLGRPRSDGLVWRLAPLVAPAQRRPVRAFDDVGYVRGLLEEGGPDRLERALGADHRDEPEAFGRVVAGEGVGGGRE